MKHPPTGYSSYENGGASDCVTSESQRKPPPPEDACCSNCQEVREDFIPGKEDGLSHGVLSESKSERMEHTSQIFKGLLNAVWDSDHARAAQLMATPVVIGEPWPRPLKDILSDKSFESPLRRSKRKRSNDTSQGDGGKKRKS